MINPAGNGDSNDANQWNLKYLVLLVKFFKVIREQFNITI